MLLYTINNIEEAEMANKAPELQCCGKEMITIWWRYGNIDPGCNWKCSVCGKEAYWDVMKGKFTFSKNK